MSQTPDLFCSGCGSERSDNFTFCGRCGKQFTSAHKSSAETITVQHTQTISNGVLVGLAAFIGLFLFIAAIALVGITSNSNQDLSDSLSAQTTETKPELTSTDTTAEQNELPESVETVSDDNPGAGDDQQKIEGKVVGVSDGDTVTVLDSSNNQHKIRLQGIDAPESGQAFGQNAKESLSNLIFGKTVSVLIYKKDKYGRSVGTIYIDGEDINLRQIKNGVAWHYKKYAGEQTPTDRQIYTKAEEQVRKERKGLWSETNPVAPWDYRGGQRSPADKEKSGIPNGAIIGNRNSRIYHWEGCPNYFDVSPRNRRFFNSSNEAENAGFRAARNCTGSAPVRSNSSVSDDRTSTVTKSDLSPIPESKSKPKQKSEKTSPSGASARCRDGSLSYSRSRRGTCSRHGGVAVWF